MIRENWVFLVDVDNTLLDSQKLKDLITQDFQKKFKPLGKTDFIKAYDEVNRITGFFDVNQISQNLAKKIGVKSTADLQHFFMNVPFEKSLFPKALENIKILQKMGRVIIFSYGDNKYQSAKIEKSGIGKIVGEKNIIIVQNKKKGVVELIGQLKKDKYTNIAIIDDVAEVLVEGYKANSKVVNVWIRYGKYKNKLPIIRSAISQEVNSINEATYFLQNFVASISPKESHLKLAILKIINEDQIKNLIEYTKTDKTIHEYTHDIERFKNPKTFSAWLKRKKIIYTLISTKGRLLGIIWFAKKVKDKYGFTFAIRVYPPARGKGLSQKFMTEVFANFKESIIYKNSKNKGFWLETREDNLRAIKLYTKFGFKKVTTKKKELLMILQNS